MITAPESIRGKHPIQGKLKTRTHRSDAVLLLTATIWGFAFVAQRAGMEHIGPFIFNAIRFALGGLSLLPILFFTSRDRKEPGSVSDIRCVSIIGVLTTGIVLFFAASLQQVGMVHTTAGKAGFITGLYVLFVPLFGLIRGQRLVLGTIFGAVMAVIGLYFLCLDERLSFSPGDGLVLIGAFFWAIHVLLIDWLVNNVKALYIAIGQFTMCSLLSFSVSAITEQIVVDDILRVTIPILYAGIMSVGIAYTLQLVAQKDAHPAHAAIILSMEAAFAALGGWLILGETINMRGMVGCGLMMSGIIASQLHQTASLKRKYNANTR